MKKKKINKDYGVSDLPHNRKEQFFDIAKHRFFLLLGLGLLLLLFSLPLLASLIYRDVLLMGLEASEAASETKEATSFSVNLLFSGLFVVSLLILSIGLGGISKILKELVYDEPIFFKDDFFKGIKENFRQYLILAVFAGIFWFFANLIYLIANNLILKVVFVGINVALIFPPVFVGFFLSTVYSNKFFKSLQGGLTIYFKAFPSVFLSFFAVYAVSFLQYIPLLLVKYLLLAVMFVVYMPFALLASFSNQTRLFDDLINKDQFPEYYHKGLSDYYER